MIKIKNLSIKVNNKKILDNLSLDFKKGKNYLILWKNGSSKSSLVSFLMWNPVYEKIDWEVFIDSQDLLQMEANERSMNWLFLSFQSVPEIPWIKLSEYLRTIYNVHLKNKDVDDNLKKWISPFLFSKFIKTYLEELNIQLEFLQRDLNVWFSWWEKRKIELLQARLLDSKYIILDEIDSWLDMDAFKVVWESIKKIDSSKNSIIVITHNLKMLDFINFDEIIVLKNWKIDKKWWLEIIKEIEEKWFE